MGWAQDFGALVVVGDAMPTIFGLDWIEFAARCCFQAGASHVVVVAPRVPAAIVTSLDRLRAEGYQIVVVRDPQEIVGHFNSVEAVLLWSGTAVPDAVTLAQIGGTAAPLVAVVDDAASEGFERIDADTRWAGYAMISSIMVRATATTVGDWDLGSTLMRRAIQADLPRLATPLPLDAADSTGVAAIVRDRIARAAGRREGWAGHWLITPLVSRITPMLAYRAPLFVTVLATMTGGLIVAAIALAAHRQAGWSAASIVLGAVLLALSRRLASAAGLRSWRPALIDQAFATLAALTLIIAAWPHGRNAAPLVLALVIPTLAVLRKRLPRAPVERWDADLPGHAVIAAIGGGLTDQGLIAAMIVMVIHATMSILVAQDRLSRVLTLSD